MKRMKTLLYTGLVLLAGALPCGASVAQSAALPASATQAPPAPSSEVIRVAWDRVGTEA